MKEADIKLLIIVKMKEERQMTNYDDGQTNWKINLMKVLMNKVQVQIKPSKCKDQLGNIKYNALQLPEGHEN